MSKSGDLELSEKTQVEEKNEYDEPVSESIGQIWRNLLVICTGFLFLFTAFQSLQALQSSLFIAEGMGTTVLAVIYGSLVLSSFFLPSPMVAALGCKWTLSIATACYILFMVAHFYAHWGLFIPAAIILGMGAAPLWTSKSHYLNTLAHDYAKKKGITNDAGANLFFGVFFLFFQSTLIWGNIISSQVLTPEGANSSITYLSPEELSLCGKSFCPQGENTNNTNLDKPPIDKLYMLAGIYTACACVGVAIVVIFLQQLPSERDKKKCSYTKETCRPTIIAATFLHMKDYRQLLLIPLTMYSGFEQAFFSSDYTQAFITCPLGRWWVGYVVICYGVVDACCSVVFGKLVEFVGRVPFFILGAVINLSLVVTFLHFTITQDNVHMYFIFAGLWGMSDAVWQTQINALYGVLFRSSSEAAFSNYRLWESIGFIIAFGYQSHFCLPIKAYILLAVLTLGILGYAVVEYQEWKKRRSVDMTK